MNNLTAARVLGISYDALLKRAERAKIRPVSDWTAKSLQQVDKDGVELMNHYLHGYGRGREGRPLAEFPRDMLLREVKAHVLGWVDGIDRVPV